MTEPFMRRVIVALHGSGRQRGRPAALPRILSADEAEFIHLSYHISMSYTILWPHVAYRLMQEQVRFPLMPRRCKAYEGPRNYNLTDAAASTLCFFPCRILRLEERSSALVEISLSAGCQPGD